jgi:sigma-B regulation protein RsbU (phosphoserine phosphatase)
MRLQARIVMLAGLSVAVLVLVSIGLSAGREQLLTDRFGQRMVAQRAALWDRSVELAATRLAALAAPLAGDPDLAAAAASGASAGLRAAAARFWPVWHETGEADRLQILGRQGQVLFTTEAAALPVPLVDARPAAGPHGGAAPLSGLRRAADGRLLVVRGIPVEGPEGDTAAVLVLAREAEAMLAELGREAGGAAVVVDREGQVLAGGPPALWQRLSPRIDLTADALQTVEAGGAVFDAVSRPVADLAGGRLGYSVTAADVTGMARRIELWRSAALVAAGLLAAGLLAWLYRYLRDAFVPLDEAIGVLDDLSRGETWQTVETDRRGDEIGRIAGAVGVVREKVMSLDRLTAAEERRRRRQQRYIRAQLLALADTLEEDARRDMLADLEEIERDSGAEGGSLGELGALAVAFQRMAVRVGDQQRRLTDLVAELRDALAHKTRLIALERELDIAAKIQAAIMPHDFPADAVLDVHARMVPAREVGGDFYDVVPLGDDRIGVAVADVSGKGVPAAFFMLIARTLLRATASFEPSPGRCLTRLNDLLSAENEQMLFVTLFFGVLDRRTGAFTYANAGHNPPYLIPAGPVEELAPTGGMALAVMGGQAYAERTVHLAPGDAAVLFSDGVTEAFDAGGEAFGEARLAGLLESGRTRDAASLVDRVIDGVLGFTGEAEQADDITCLALRLRGGGCDAEADARGDADG